MAYLDLEKEEDITSVDQIDLELSPQSIQTVITYWCLKQTCCSSRTNNHKNMAEAALVGIAKAVLQQLTAPALKEFKLIWGHQTHLDRLRDTVNTIKNVLEDAERRRPTDTAVQGWLARLRIMLYDADDLFDYISYRVLNEKTKTGSMIGKEVSPLLPSPYHFTFVVKTAQKVKAIRKRLDHIARDIGQFNFIPCQYETGQEQSNRVRREQTHSYIPSSMVVGREQEREDIIKLLLPDNCEDKRGVSVVAVIGIGGMGKTTLGQFIYNDDRVQQGFDLCLWCCVNCFSDLKGTLETIISAATGSAEPKGLYLDQLQCFLRNTIDGKRFLLVLDDVWDEDALRWGKLQVLLDSGGSGSMVLVTTRSVEVAQSMGAAKPYYRLQGLSDENAWLLFKRMAFGEDSEEHNCRDLEQSGRQIVKRCGNAPLSVVIIASLLRHKERNKWFPLVNDELSKVVPFEHSKIMQVLKMSYNELSSSVKRCFAYCSLFPKDEDLDKDMLVRMWIAQGFVEDCAAGQGLEDIAEDYFFCLLNRCFIQKSMKGDSFKMHDLVHDLASEVAGSENILVDKNDPNFGDNTLRHVSLSCANADSSVEQLSSFSQSKRLRTLLFGQSIVFRKIGNFDKLTSCFKAIRVLDLSSVYIKEIPDSIEQFIHLRYLDLSGSDMEMLPSSICNLHRLQSLILCGSRYLRELPKQLGNLISLRHLEIEGCVKLTEMPQGLADLTSLVTLDRLIVHRLSGGLRYMECLDNLSGSLRIELPRNLWKNVATDAQKACLAKKHRLQHLDIWWKSEVFETSDMVMNILQPHSNLVSLNIFKFCGVKMPRWISLIHNLVSLGIYHCRRCLELPSLRHLQFLKKLEIGYTDSMVVIEDDGIGNMSDISDSIFFPSLETLAFNEMPNFTSWWKQSTSFKPVFRRLTKVTIRDCPMLTACMPLFPQVEDLVLRDIQEEPFWQAISSNETSRLKRLRLENIHGLRSLPGAQICHLSSLQSLQICKQRELAVSFISGLAYLTSLEELKILTCEELELIDDDSAAKISEMPGGRLPRLGKLEISVVGKCVFCKLFKYLTSLEELTVHKFKEELLQLKETEEEEGMVWKSLHKLRSMKIGSYSLRCQTIRQTLPRGVEYLTSLKELIIIRCKELYLSWGVVLSLHRLRILEMEDVDRVIDVDSIAKHRQLSPLKELRVSGSSGEWMVDIPWRSFSSLHSLDLRFISNLKALPEGIQHLTTLQNLKMSGCTNVESLPHWMTNLTSLHSLDIVRCSDELKERCKKPTGEDWVNIRHISHITTR